MQYSLTNHHLYDIILASMIHGISHDVQVTFVIREKSFGLSLERF
jgi:hypothetical protein